MPSRARLDSNALLRRWGADLQGDVLSLGSGNDRDGEGHQYREYFPRATSYTTSDVGEAGEGCDQQLDVRAMPDVPDHAYDVIFCSGVLEHVDDTAAALREIWRVLAPGGVLLLGVPFRQPIHRAPYDFWRFTTHGIQQILADYTVDAVVGIDERDGPAFPAAYWAKARKSSPDPAPDRLPTLCVDATASSTPIAAPSADGLPTAIVCWRWTPADGYHAYGPETVNTLRRMVARHYRHPHRFICVTDDPTGLDPKVDVVPIWSDFADLPNPHGPRFPGCYRRLRAFSSEIAEVFGPRFVSIDLDCVIVDDLTPLWDRPEPFVIWSDTHPRCRYNGSMFLLSSGSRRQVWEQFDPQTSPAATLADGQCNGSDQGWVSYCLGTGEATWSAADGVYSFKNEVKRGELPTNARIVLFHGSMKPWSPDAQRIAWVARHYRLPGGSRARRARKKP